MWCANCQADVAAEVSADNRHVRCATCSAVLDTPQTLRASARTREARELLERWAHGSLFDPYGASASTPASAATPDAPTAPTSSSFEGSAPPSPPRDAGPSSAPLRPAAAAPALNPPTSRRSIRVDTSHTVGGARLGAPDDATQASRATAPLTTDPSVVAGDAPSPEGPRTVTRRRPTARPLDSAMGSKPMTTGAADRTRPPLQIAALADSVGNAATTDADRLAALSSRSPAPIPGMPIADMPMSTMSAPPAFASSGSAAVGASSVATSASGFDVRSAPPTPHRRFDPPHATVPSPHFEAARFQESARKANATSLAGQFLAYGGVLGLTIGTAMVLWGYFGGPEHFTPTGWLITTVGQMLLFLGVVTLVSGGMEQTTDEVARRIEHLGERLLRIEQAARESGPRGPDASGETAETRGTNRRAV